MVQFVLTFYFPPFLLLCFYYKGSYVQKIDTSLLDAYESFCTLYTNNLKREADFSASLLIFRRNYFSLRLLTTVANPKIANPNPANGELLSLIPVFGNTLEVSFTADSF